MLITRILPGKQSMGSCGNFRLAESFDEDPEKLVYLLCALTTPFDSGSNAVR